MAGWLDGWIGAKTYDGIEERVELDAHREVVVLRLHVGEARLHSTRAVLGCGDHERFVRWQRRCTRARTLS